MITKVVLAKLSPTMEEGTIVKWTKKEGDAVKVGDVMAEIETDKANMEMEALGAGVLRKILVPAGGKAPVGSLIGVIADPKEDIGALLAQAPAATTAAPAPTPAPGPVAVAPAVVAAAPMLAIAPGGPADGRVKASPLARTMAARQNIPLAAVAGSGPGGRIVKRDIEGYVAGSPGARAVSAAPPAPAVAPAPVVPFPSVAAGRDFPLSNMRKTIARRLAESKFSAPHFYVTVEIDMGPAVALREQLLKGEDLKVSFNDLVLRACAQALTRFPMVNASWGGDKITTHGEIHLGVAVSIPDGLITPVVRNADRKSVLEISKEVKDLAARAREKKLRPEEFVGSTFTISNLGMLDVSEFTAIINPPEAAILAVGGISDEPVVKDGAVVAGKRMTLTLSCDHRVIDGALGAKLLAVIIEQLEAPEALAL